MKRALAVTLLVVGCNQQSIQTPLRSFDRPSDVALACAHYDPNRNAISMRPIGDCNPDLATANAIVVPKNSPLPANFSPPLGSNPYIPFVVPLVTQSARGELALIDGAQNRLIDADPLKPGFGFLPVGKMPEHVRVSADGCFATTSNTDSCDFGVVDLSTVMRNSLLLQKASDMGSGQVDLTKGVARINATVPAPGGGTRALYARPAWIEVAADETPATPYVTGGAPRECTGGVHKVWAAFPACQLVVKMRVDATSGPNVEQAIRITPTGASPVTDLSTIDCPAECAGAPVDGGAAPSPSPSDMGVGGHPSTQSFPGTLAVDGEGGRLVVGDLYGERIDIIPMDASGGLGAPRAVHLERGAGGVRIARISPRSSAGKFLYAIARDGTIRVVDLDREVECETNPDPRFVGGGVDLQQTPSSSPPLPSDPNAQARRLGCFPLGDPSTPLRAALARSPGIELSAGQLPTDVAFVHGSVPPISPSSTAAPPAAGPGLLVGDFAWITTSDGRGLIVNIYDACPAPNQQDVNRTAAPYTPVCSSDPNDIRISQRQTAVQFGHPEPMLLDRLSHRLRSGHGRFVAPFNASDTAGQPRVTDETNPCAVAVPPTSPGAPDGGVPDAGVGVCGGTAALPRFYAEPVPPAFLDQTQNPTHADTWPTRIVRFVDPDRARNETWVASWEAPLPGTSRVLGAAVHGGYWADPGGQWCAHGVLAGDKLIVKGCADDSECDHTGGFQCVHDPGAFPDVSNGLCLPIDNKTLTTDFWSAHCGKLLRAQRKFRITSARQGQKPPWDATSPPLDYLALAEIYEPEYAEETHACDDTQGKPSDALCADVTVSVGGAPKPTSCLADYDGVDRCLLPCSSDKDCGVDFECAKSRAGDQRCMRAPLDDTLWFSAVTLPNGKTAGCIQELQQYEIHVGGQFLVGGTTSGSLVTDVIDASGECRAPAPSTLFARDRQSRLPLTPSLVCPHPVLPPDAMHPNDSPLASLPPSAPSNVCYSDGGGLRTIHYQNPLFNVALQIPQPGSTYPKVIMPPDGTAVSFAITGGGAALSVPLGVDVQAQQPRYTVVAPDRQTVYVVDEGKSISASGLRGQLLRLFTPSQTVDHLFVVR